MSSSWRSGKSKQMNRKIFHMLLISFLLMISTVPAVELDCIQNLVGAYTVSQDLSCTAPFYATVGSGTVVIDVMNAARIDGVTFIVFEGAMLQFTGATITMSGCHNSETKGGALYLYPGGEAVFESPVQFVDNSASGGGAVFVDTAGSLTFEAAATFENNICVDSWYGGALYVGVNATVNFGGDATFFNNSAANGNGGALYINAGAAVFESSASFVETSAINGAVYIDLNAAATFKGVTYFESNTIINNGGAIANYGVATFEDSVFFQSNSIGGGGNGGAVYIFGGGAASFAKDAFFVNNTGGAGGTFYTYGTATFAGPVGFYNNTAFLLAGALVIAAEGSVTFEESVTFFNNTATTGGALSIANGIGIFKADTTFSSNRATEGSAFFIASLGSATFDGSVTFSDNVATNTGGGAFIYPEGLATFNGPLNFLNNTAKLGGALAIQGAATFTSSIIFNNNTATDGGALHYIDGRDPTFPTSATFEGSLLFVNNSVTGNGGAVSAGLPLSLKNATFNSNTADGSGGAIYSFIVPNYILAGNPFQLEDVIFTNNVATLKGGGICMDACDSLYMVNITASSNVATDGGFLSLLSCPVGWFNSTATSNTASSRAGAMMLQIAPAVPPDSAPWVVDGTSISSDTPSSIVTSVYFDSNTAGTGGGGLFIDSSSIAIDGCTFIKGSSVSGSAVYFGAFLKAEMNNCMLDGNSAVSSGGSVYLGIGSVLEIDTGSFTNSESLTGAGGTLFGDSLSQITLTSVNIHQSASALYGGGVSVESSGTLNISTSSITNSTSQCCYLDETQDFESYDYTCSDLNYGGSSIYDCCLPDQFWNSSACIACDSTTMNCSMGTSVYALSLTDGYWRATNYTTDIRECWNTDACIGGNGTVGFSEDAQYCAAGYLGPYCAVCEDNYFSASGRSCSQCASSFSAGMIVWSLLLILFFLCAVGVVTAYLIMGENDASPSDSEYLSTLKKWAIKFGRLNWGRLRIPIVAAQIVSQGVEVMGISLPSAYEKFLAWASFANLDINMLPSLDCVISTDFYDRLRFVTLFPLFCVLYLCMTYSIVVWKAHRVTAVSSFTARSGDSLRPARLEEAKLKHFRAFLVLTFLVYSTVSSTIFQTYACDDVQDGPNLTGTNYSYLRVDYSLMCNTSKHTRYMVYAGFMIIVYPLGIPALYSFLLWRSREHFTNLSVVENTLQPAIDSELAPSSDLQFVQEVNEEEPEVMVAKPSSMMVSGQELVDSSRFFWSAYVPLFFYWEVLECGRRILMTGFVVFLFPGTAIQISLTCLFALASIIVICIYHPHEDRFERMLYIWGALLIFLTQYLGLNMKVDVGNETAQSQAAFSALLIFLHAGMTIAALVNMWLGGKSALDTRQQSLFSAVNINN